MTYKASKIRGLRTSYTKEKTVGCVRSDKKFVLRTHFFGRRASKITQLLGLLEQLMALAHTQRVCSSCAPCTLRLPSP
jgi:hypothetical protein